MTTTSTHPLENHGELKPHQRIAQKLLGLRDELLLKNHLAKMDVKESVEAFGKELERLAGFLRQRIETAAITWPTDAEHRIYLALFDTNARLLEMEASVKAALSGAADSAAVVAETARLKAALARMEAEAALESGRGKVKEEMHKIEARTAQLFHDIEAKLNNFGAK